MQKLAEEIRNSSGGGFWSVESGLVEAVAHDLQSQAWSVLVISGSDCSTKQDLMTEFSAEGGFPEYFGRNWDALNDCLTDLSWLPPVMGYLLVITDADMLLRDEDASEHAALHAVLANVIDAWGNESVQHDYVGHAAGSVPFHVLLGGPSPQS